MNRYSSICPKHEVNHTSMGEETNSEIVKHMLHRNNAYFDLLEGINKKREQDIIVKGQSLKQLERQLNEKLITFGQREPNIKRLQDELTKQLNTLASRMVAISEIYVTIYCLCEETLH